MSKLLLIDGNAILHRAYHAIPFLTAKDGEPTNAVYGLVSMLIRLIEDISPTHIAVCFDRPEPTFRKVEFDKYQAHRPQMEENLLVQFGKAKEVLQAMNIKIFEKPGYEADDLIGSISKLATSKDIDGVDEVVIVTGDRDILQLVDDSKKIRVFMPVGGFSNGKLYTERDVLERIGVRPDRIVDYKALVGDASDNYSGIRGIGPKGAVALLSKFDSWDGIKKNLDRIDKNLRMKIRDNLENGDLSYRLARIVTDLDVDIDFSQLKSWNIASKTAEVVLAKLGFKSLIRRITGHSTISSGVKEEKSSPSNKRLDKEMLEAVVAAFYERMGDNRFAIRGTASLKLQGFDFNVDDIDVICDQKTVEFIQKEFEKEIIREIKYSETDKYRSYFGQIVLNGVLLEIMANFQYRNSKGKWSNVYDGADNQVNFVKVRGMDIRVTKPEVELEFAVSLGRWREYSKLKKQIQGRMQDSLFKK